MNTHISYLIVGLGQTGLSCVRYLKHQNLSVAVADTRENPPGLIECQTQFPDVSIHLGPFSKALFLQADTLVVSPGVSLDIPEIAAAREKGARIIGDIELFVQAARAPIVAITGSNGKTTLTTLMGKMINDAGRKAIVCGNIGVPVLDILDQPTPDYYVIELSSFQLETTESLKAKVAVVINISPDHLDRHPTVAAYLAAKKRIYHHCETAVVNADEPECWSEGSFKNPPVLFTVQQPKANEWGIKDNALYFGAEKIVSISDLPLKEKHNCQNFLAVLAMGSAIGLPLRSMINTLKSFTGLPHRCQLVSQKNGIRWINDSKATNVGAAVAAIDSISQNASGKIILIAGGDSKGVALDDLKNPVRLHISHVITLGRDAGKIEEALNDCVKIISVKNMQEAVLSASKIAAVGDTVLLSPACSSLDQYESYVARGNDFIRAVEMVIPEK